MLPLAAQQCSLMFALKSDLIGGFAGGLGLIINLLLVRGGYMIYQKIKNHTQHGITSTN